MKTISQGLLFITIIAINLNPGFAQEKEIFEDFQQILPRGGIPAIINPKYVTAEEADDTWVLGVVINDQPRAYSLNLLNHHEIVNDLIDTTVFAAVW
jgi:hypothetical protein